MIFVAFLWENLIQISTADLSHLSASFTKWVVTDDDKHGNSKPKIPWQDKSRAFVSDSLVRLNLRMRWAVAPHLQLGSHSGADTYSFLNDNSGYEAPIGEGNICIPSITAVQCRSDVPPARARESHYHRGVSASGPRRHLPALSR